MEGGLEQSQGARREEAARLRGWGKRGWRDLVEITGTLPGPARLWCWGWGHHMPWFFWAGTLGGGVLRVTAGCSWFAPSLGLGGLSGAALLCFCLQPRSWSPWPCTAGASLGPVLGPGCSRLEASTPVCLMEKVRWEDLTWSGPLASSWSRE